MQKTKMSRLNAQPTPEKYHLRNVHCVDMQNAVAKIKKIATHGNHGAIYVIQNLLTLHGNRAHLIVAKEKD